MAEHTPGPWTVSQPWQGFSALYGADGKLVFGVAAGAPEEKRPDAECDANARLIASAPAMLEALKEIVDTFESVDLGIEQIARRMRGLARTAIIKAEGRE